MTKKKLTKDKKYLENQKTKKIQKKLITQIWPKYTHPIPTCIKPHPCRDVKRVVLRCACIDICL